MFLEERKEIKRNKKKEERRKEQKLAGIDRIKLTKKESTKKY